jgi:hypothetical protein
MIAGNTSAQDSRAMQYPADMARQVRWRAILILCAIAGCAAQPATPPADGIWFRMDTTAAAWPLAGWPWAVDDHVNQRWSSQHVPGAGPQGQDVVQLTELPGSGQHGWGWHGHVVPDMAAGETRVFRWRHRVLAESNCRHTPSNKLLIVAQGCRGGRCRVIVQPKCNPDGRIQYNFQIDGGMYQEETGYVYPKGRWLDVQFEMKTSSAPGVEDGWLKEWIDNNNYGKPTIQNVGIELRAGGDDSSYVIFGGYNNAEDVPPGSTNVQQYADFQVAASFDPKWDRPEK